MLCLPFTSLFFTYENTTHILHEAVDLVAQVLDEDRAQLDD